MRLFSSKLRAFLVSIFLLASVHVCAQSSEPYPSKPVRLIVPFAPGATTDFLGRAIAQHMTQAWGKSVLVENKIGAGGLIGADATAKSAPDGYTLALSPSTPPPN